MQQSYGSSPYIYPCYGLGGLPESFSRLAAIHGGTFMLNRGVDEVLFDEDGCAWGVRGGDEVAKGTMFVGDPSYFPKVHAFKLDPVQTYLSSRMRSEVWLVLFSMCSTAVAKLPGLSCRYLSMHVPSLKHMRASSHSCSLYVHHFISIPLSLSNRRNAARRAKWRGAFASWTTCLRAWGTPCRPKSSFPAPRPTSAPTCT